MAVIGNPRTITTPGVQDAGAARRTLTPDDYSAAAYRDYQARKISHAEYVKAHTAGFYAPADEPVALKPSTPRVSLKTGTPLTALERDKAAADKQMNEVARQFDEGIIGADELSRINLEYQGLFGGTESKPPPTVVVTGEVETAAKGEGPAKSKKTISSGATPQDVVESEEERRQRETEERRRRIGIDNPIEQTYYDLMIGPNGEPREGATPELMRQMQDLIKRTIFPEQPSWLYPLSPPSKEEIAARWGLTDVEARILGIAPQDRVWVWGEDGKPHIGPGFDKAMNVYLTEIQIKRTNFIQEADLFYNQQLLNAKNAAAKADKTTSQGIEQQLVSLQKQRFEYEKLRDAELAAVEAANRAQDFAQAKLHQDKADEIANRLATLQENTLAFQREGRAIDYEQFRLQMQQAEGIARQQHDLAKKQYDISKDTLAYQQARDDADRALQAARDIAAQQLAREAESGATWRFTAGEVGATTRSAAQIASNEKLAAAQATLTTSLAEADRALRAKDSENAKIAQDRAAQAQQQIIALQQQELIESRRQFDIEQAATTGRTAAQLAESRRQFDIEQTGVTGRTTAQLAESRRQFDIGQTGTAAQLAESQRQFNIGQTGATARQRADIASREKIAEAQNVLATAQAEADRAARAAETTSDRTLRAEEVKNARVAQEKAAAAQQQLIALQQQTQAESRRQFDIEQGTVTARQRESLESAERRSAAEQAEAAARQREALVSGERVSATKIAAAERRNTASIASAETIARAQIAASQAQFDRQTQLAQDTLTYTMQRDTADRALQQAIQAGNLAEAVRSNKASEAAAARLADIQEEQQKQQFLSNMLANGGLMFFTLAQMDSQAAATMFRQLTGAEASLTTGPLADAARFNQQFGGAPGAGFTTPSTQQLAQMGPLQRLQTETAFMGRGRNVREEATRLAPRTPTESIRAQRIRPRRQAR